MEMTITTPAIEEYAEAHTTPDTELLAQIALETRETMEYPQMLSGPSVGRLLGILAHVTGAKRVLEVGTFTGYSALSIAPLLGDGAEIITCEFDPETAKVAQSNFDASKFGHMIDLRVAPALETLATLSGPFDLVFIDADKREYSQYLTMVLPMLSDRGIIVVDNTLWSGRVLDKGASDVTDDTIAIAAFNDAVAANSGLDCVMLTVRDGVTLITKKTR